MRTCAICGKEIDILYPEYWRYKRGGTPTNPKAWLCSWKCLRIWDDPKKRKEAEEMARMKKDGTPAAKPGRKPKEEKPKVILQYDESIREEYRREQEAMAAAVEQPQPETEWIQAAEVYGEPEEVKKMDAVVKEAAEEYFRELDKHLWTVTAIRSEEWGEFYFDEKHRCIDWRHPGGEEVSLPLADWVRLPEVIPQILKMLGVG